jgi:hypothetical protein
VAAALIRTMRLSDLLVFYDFDRVYLDSTLEDPSTTSTTKLPPVQAHLVYHPRVKAKTSAPTRPMPIRLRGLDAGWCVKLGPHRKGTRSRRLSQTADRHIWGAAHGRQEGRRGDRFGDSS